MTLLDMVSELIIPIEERMQTIQLIIEIAIGLDSYYFIQAIIETVFDFCIYSYDYFRNISEILNTHLKSERFIANEMLVILE